MILLTFGFMTKTHCQTAFRAVTYLRVVDLWPKSGQIPAAAKILFWRKGGTATSKRREKAREDEHSCLYHPI